MYEIKRNNCWEKVLYLVLGKGAMHQAAVSACISRSPWVIPGLQWSDGTEFCASNAMNISWMGVSVPSDDCVPHPTFWEMSGSYLHGLVFILDTYVSVFTVSYHYFWYNSVNGKREFIRIVLLKIISGRKICVMSWGYWYQSKLWNIKLDLKNWNIISSHLEMRGL